MFKVIVNRDNLLEQMGEEGVSRFAMWKRLAEVKLTQRFIKIAAPAIKANLKSATNVPPKNGMRQFYDEQTAVEMRNRGERNVKSFSPNRSNYINHYEPSDHLLDQWEVEAVPNERGGTLLISNNKMVPGKSRDFSLFKLLFLGTSYFVMPVPLRKAERELAMARGGYEKYIERVNRTRRRVVTYQGDVTLRAKGGRKEVNVPLTPEERAREKKMAMSKRGVYSKSDTSTWKQEMRDLEAGFYGFERAVEQAKGAGFFNYPRTKKIKNVNYVPMRKIKDYMRVVEVAPSGGQEWEKPKRMSFYCRYMGRFYYNLSQRRGIEKDVVRDFRNFIADSVYEGLIYGVNESFRKGQTNEKMRKAFKGVEIR